MLAYTKHNTKQNTCTTNEKTEVSDFFAAEVSAGFKPGTSIRYDFKDPTVKELNISSSVLSDSTLRAENISLSFRTSQSPALLLYVGSYHREYLAVLLNKQGERRSLYLVALRTRRSAGSVILLGLLL